MEENDKISENSIEKLHSEFLATLSHELRTPLTSIRGFADTMLLSYNKLSDEQKIKFLNVIKEQSNRLITLVENLLSITKNKSENLIFKSISPMNVINKAILILKNKTVSNNIIIQDKTSEIKIFVDEDKFLQIIINLLDNAIKYSENNTDIFISIDETLESVIIKIKNKGPIIDKNDFEKIFMKFSRIDTPYTRKTEGSGIGLYIVKSLTEKMGGEIIALPCADGACFQLSFPLAKYDESAIKKFQRE